MSTWNYRLVRTTMLGGINVVGLYEVYYDDDVPVSRTEAPAEFVADTAEELAESLAYAVRALSMPVLDDETFAV